MRQGNYRLVCAAAAAIAIGSVGSAQAQEGARGFPQGIWTLQDENASVSTSTPTDRYYVNGLALGWTSLPGAAPAPLAAFGHALMGPGSERISLGLEQQVFTASDTSAIDPPANDEPYAGYLAATVSLIDDTATTRSVAGIAAGVIGRDAGAEVIQNNFHTIIGQKGTHGWAYQLPSEPALDLFGGRIWRVPLGQFGDGIEADALPQISGMAGLTQDYVQPAVGFRIGQGLDSDFGPALLAPSPSGTDAYAATRPVVWYLFGSAALRAVAHDETLQGADFQSSRSVDPYVLVGSFELGASVIWRDLRFSYTQVFETKRFYGQGGSLHEFGSFSVSALF